MSGKFFFPDRTGMAIIIVLILSVVLMVSIGTMFSLTKQQRGTHEHIFAQTRALMAAKSAVQLALYKFRVLPSEFYRLKENGLNDEAYGKYWFADFNPIIKGSPAQVILRNLKNADGAKYDFGVTDFSIISRLDKGYKRDYIRIRAWGVCDGFRKEVEELIEVAIIEL